MKITKAITAAIMTWAMSQAAYAVSFTSGEQRLNLIPQKAAAALATVTINQP